MKKIAVTVGVLWLLFMITACGDDVDSEASASQTDVIDTIESETIAKPEQANAEQVNSEQVNSEQVNSEQGETEIMLNIQVGEHLLTATLAQNSSVDALVEMLAEGPVTIDMSDYANMEKVGTLPASLPRNDEQISTGAGDLILYQGNSFVIYYGTNSWSLTRLGKVNDVTQQELKDILGEGDVTVTLSLDSE